MDGEETVNCPNCKRDIPRVNFTTHSVHCARNIRVCPACKEPVAADELVAHHSALHAPHPCLQCGERVCGADLEDHVRDSCARTPRACRYCDLEVPRADLPPHEQYCGVRTERCPDCHEWVMIKYRQLHLDSNHGFIRLHDDPAPPKNLKSNNILKCDKSASTSRTANIINAYSAKYNGENGLPQASTSRHNGDNVKRTNELKSEYRQTQWSPGTGAGRAKRTNDQPQINIDMPNHKHIDKDTMCSRRGVVKKRAAPPPPAQRVELRDLKPMSAEQFVSRVSALQLGAAPAPDRFDQIKSSLTELRRGLNHLTAPYTAGAPPPEDRLPCEFCAELFPPHRLVQHQTGCRPDLAQLRPPSSSPSPPPPSPTLALIPCEFCLQPLPLHRVDSHQQHCARAHSPH